MPTTVVTTHVVSEPAPHRLDDRAEQPQDHIRQHQAHLYFDEQDNGPTAISSLAGTVCVTGNSTVDTDNSSTVLNIVTTCGTP